MKCSYIEKGIRLKLYSQNNEAYIFTKPCCHMHHDLIPEEYRRFTKMDSVQISDIMNIGPLKYFRNYFAENDSLHPSCVPCINYESNGMKSPRIYENENDYGDYDIARLDVVLSNLCNLACPFCSSHASSLIDKLSNELKPKDKPSNWIPIRESHNFDQPKSYDTSELVSEILKHYKVHTLKLLGGEPFLKENWNKIAETIDSGLYSDLNMHITTNGTVINDKVINTLRKVKKVDLLISVDSIENNYELIRWPHKWERMKRNLDYIYSQDLPNVNIVIANLVNIFNFEYLPEIEEYFDNASYQFEIQPSDSLHNFRLLPESIINMVKSKLQSEELKKACVPIDHDVPKGVISREIKVLLKQRKMNAADCIGPMTREYFEL